jgi:hypothetical protein
MTMRLCSNRRVKWLTVPYADVCNWLTNTLSVLRPPLTALQSPQGFTTFARPMPLKKTSNDLGIVLDHIISAFSYVATLEIEAPLSRPRVATPQCN